MALKEKRRILAADHLSHIDWTRDIRNPPGDYQAYFTENITIYSSQLTRSEGHAWPIGRGKWDSGGQFDTIKLLYFRDPKLVYEITERPFTFTETYRKSSTIPLSFGIPTPFIDPYGQTFDQWAELASPSASRTNLITLGTKFINQTIPTNPVVDGSVALAELFREGIPSMIGSALLKGRADFFRSLGSEYLNIEFGWKPLVSDAQKAAKAVIESERIIKNLVQHSGRDLVRKRLLPPSKEIAVFNGTVYNPTWLPTSYLSGTPRYEVTDTTTRQQWFSGCYNYHVDLGSLSEISRIATEARLLYGLKLTPDVLWNLAPWSWLVDWFANVGPLLSNVSAFQNDGLVLKYGYVMEHVTRDVPRRNVATVNRGSHPPVVHDRFLIEWKRREKATPFGFGLNTAAFTNRQWAILGALGLTRIPKSL